MTELTPELYSELQGLLADPTVPEERRAKYRPMMDTFEQTQKAADADRVALGRDPEGTVLPAALPETLAAPPEPTTEVKGRVSVPFSFSPEDSDDSPYFYNDPSQGKGESDEAYEARKEEKWKKVLAEFQKKNAPVIRVSKVDQDMDIGLGDELQARAAGIYEPILGGIDESITGGAGRELLAGLGSKIQSSPKVTEALTALQESGEIGTAPERIRDNITANPMLALGGNLAGLGLPGMGRSIIGQGVKLGQKVSQAGVGKLAQYPLSSKILAKLSQAAGGIAGGAAVGGGLEGAEQLTQRVVRGADFDPEAIAMTSAAGAALPLAALTGRGIGSLIPQPPAVQKALAAGKEVIKVQKNKISAPAAAARERLEKGYASKEKLTAHTRKPKDALEINAAKEKYKDAPEFLAQIERLQAASPKAKYIKVAPRRAHDTKSMSKFLDDLHETKSEVTEAQIRTMLKNSPSLQAELATFLAAPGTKIQKVQQFIKNHKGKGDPIAGAVLSKAFVRLLDAQEKETEKK